MFSYNITNMSYKRSLVTQRKTQGGFMVQTVRLVKNNERSFTVNNITEIAETMLRIKRKEVGKKHNNVQLHIMGLSQLGVGTLLNYENDLTMIKDDIDDYLSGRLDEGSEFKKYKSLVFSIRY